MSPSLLSLLWSALLCPVLSCPRRRDLDQSLISPLTTPGWLYLFRLVSSRLLLHLLRRCFCAFTVSSSGLGLYIAYIIINLNLNLNLAFEPHRNRVPLEASQSERVWVDRTTRTLDVRYQAPRFRQIKETLRTVEANNWGLTLGHIGGLGGKASKPTQPLISGRIQF